MCVKQRACKSHQSGCLVSENSCPEIESCDKRGQSGLIAAQRIACLRQQPLVAPVQSVCAYRLLVHVHIPLPYVSLPYVRAGLPPCFTPPLPVNSWVGRTGTMLIGVYMCSQVCAFIELTADIPCGPLGLATRAPTNYLRVNSDLR